MEEETEDLGSVRLAAGILLAMRPYVSYRITYRIGPLFGHPGSRGITMRDKEKECELDEESRGKRPNQSSRRDVAL
jgi:hypothetical protein